MLTHIVYISDDTLRALGDYLKTRPEARTQKLFLVQKGTYQNQPLSMQGIQKRMEYYAKKTGLKVPCHYLLGMRIAW